MNRSLLTRNRDLIGRFETTDSQSLVQFVCPAEEVNTKPEGSFTRFWTIYFTIFGFYSTLCTRSSNPNHG